MKIINSRGIVLLLIIAIAVIAGAAYTGQQYLKKDTSSFELDGSKKGNEVTVIKLKLHR